jgi:hypothetical protein
MSESAVRSCLRELTPACRTPLSGATQPCAGSGTARRRSQRSSGRQRRDVRPVIPAESTHQASRRCACVPSRRWPAAGGEQQHLAGPGGHDPAARTDRRHRNGLRVLLRPGGCAAPGRGRPPRAREAPRTVAPVSPGRPRRGMARLVRRLHGCRAGRHRPAFVVRSALAPGRRAAPVVGTERTAYAYDRTA